MEKIDPRKVIEVPSDVFVTHRALYDHFGDNHKLTVRLGELIEPVVGGFSPEQIEINESERNLITSAWEARSNEPIDSPDREHVRLRLAGVSIKETLASYVSGETDVSTQPKVIIIDEDYLVVSGLSTRDFARR